MATLTNNTTGTSVDTSSSGKSQEVNLPPGFEPMEGVKTNRTLRATASFVAPVEEEAGIGSRRSSMVGTISRRDSFVTADYSAGVQSSDKPRRTTSMSSINDARSSHSSKCTTPDTFASKNRGGNQAIPSPSYKQVSGRGKNNNNNNNNKKRGNMSPLSPTSASGGSGSAAVGSPATPLASFAAVSTRRRMGGTTSSVTTVPAANSTESSSAQQAPTQRRQESSAQHTPTQRRQESSAQHTPTQRKPESPTQNFTVTSVVVGGPGGIGSFGQKNTSSTPVTPTRTPPPADTYTRQSPTTSASSATKTVVSRRPRAVVEATPVASSTPPTSSTPPPTAAADSSPVMAYEVGPDGQMKPVYYLPSGQTLPVAEVAGSPISVVNGTEAKTTQQPAVQMESAQYAAGPVGAPMQFLPNVQQPAQQLQEFQGLQVQHQGQAVDALPMPAPAPVATYPPATAPDMWKLVPMEETLPSQEAVPAPVSSLTPIAVEAPGDAMGIPNFMEGVEALIDLEA